LPELGGLQAVFGRKHLADKNKSAIESVRCISTETVTLSKLQNKKQR
jgi:hypothetical protein